MNYLSLKKRLSSLLLAAIVSPTALAENTATMPIQGAGENRLTRTAAINARVQEGNVDLLYIGDSIVQNWDDEGRAVWNHYYAHRNAVNMGISGDRTEHVLWRLQHGHLEGIAPRLAIVMIGQNNGPHNTGDEIGAGVTAIVEELQKKLPETKILLLAIFPRREKPTEERAVLARANEISARLADNQTIYYMDVCHLYLREGGVIPSSLMPDYEHPNAEGHRVWAEAIESKVAALFGDPPVSPLESLAISTIE